jgi:low affinity Fe/Cu permease
VDPRDAPADERRPERQVPDAINAAADAASLEASASPDDKRCPKSGQILRNGGCMRSGITGTLGDATMETTDLTITILQNIRADITKLEARLDARIDRLDAKLDGKIDREIAAVRRDMQNLVTRDEFREAFRILEERIDRLHARMIESEVRATTAHQELQATLGQIMTYLGGHGSLEARVDRCEHDIIDLKERVL